VFEATNAGHDLYIENPIEVVASILHNTISETTSNCFKNKYL